jgi:hypothetical protein
MTDTTPNILPICNYNSDKEHLLVSNLDKLLEFERNLRTCDAIVLTFIIPLIGIIWGYYSYTFLFPNQQQKKKTRFSIGNIFYYMFAILINLLWISCAIYIPIYKKRIETIKNMKSPCQYESQIYL